MAKQFSGWIAGILGITLMLTGCAKLNPPEVEGTIDKKAEHAIVPENGKLYKIKNIQKPGTDVFIFTSEEALVSCYNALKQNTDLKEGCGSGIEAVAPDGSIVETIECHKSEHAICQIHPITKEPTGIKAYIMWDWLEPHNQAK